MKGILLLNDSQFPAKFGSINITPPAGKTRTAYTEDRLISSINRYNPKLNVSEIEYISIEDQFPRFIKGKSNGALIEEFEIDPAVESTYKNNGCYVYSDSGRRLCRRILMYVFVSDTSEDARNSLISQAVFPTLLDYAENFIDSPSYTIADHKFCFINMLPTKITAETVLRNLASLYAAGMDYVEVFDNGSLDTKKIPNDLYEFLRSYPTSFINKYDEKTRTYEGDNYLIDFSAGRFIWKTSKLNSGLVRNATNPQVDFYGSSEKFFWIETLPLTIFAYNCGFQIDYSEYKDFIDTNRSKFSPNSKKFARCETLLKYLDKYIK